MRKPHGPFVLVVLVCVALAYQTPKAQSPAAGAEIAKVSDAYVKASLAADAKAIAALYTEDAVEMPPNQPMVKGRAAIEQVLHQAVRRQRQVAVVRTDEDREQRVR